MFGLAIKPNAKGDEQKLSAALHKLAEEDPCFRIEHNKELNEMVISGLRRAAPAADARAHEGALASR